MNLESRLSDHLKSVGDQMAVPAGDASQPAAVAGRRRRRRRTGTAALAALVVAVGGLGAYRLATEDDRAQDIVAADDNQDDQTDGGPSDTTDTGDTGDNESAATDGADTQPPPEPQLPPSTGPVLSWVEVEGPPGIDQSTLAWTGDAFISLAREQGSDDGILYRSVDGRSWTRGEVPDGFDPWSLVTDGQGTLLLWASDPDAPAEQVEAPIASRVAVSQDGGQSWQELDLPETSDETPSPYIQRLTAITGVAALDDTVVVTLISFLNLDFDGLLADNGIEADEFGYGLSFGDADSTISVCRDEFCTVEEDYSFEELGLPPEAGELLNQPNESASLLRSTAGGPLEPIDVGPFEGFISNLATVDDQLVFQVTTGAFDETEPTVELYVSSDGVTWTSRPTDVAPFQMLWSDTAVLYSGGLGGGSGGLGRSQDLGQSWTQIETGDVVIEDLSGSAAGVVVIGTLQAILSDPISTVLEGERDGYRLVMGDEALVLTDPDGTVVVELGPEEMAAEEPPEFLVVDEQSFGFTFLDPETGEELVTFTEEDFPDLFGFDDATYSEPSSAIGWSADRGETWGWQTTTDAFGIDGWAQVAINDEVAVATVHDNNGATPARFFLAELS